MLCFLIFTHLSLDRPMVFARPPERSGHIPGTRWRPDRPRRPAIPPARGIRSKSVGLAWFGWLSLIDYSNRSNHLIVKFCWTSMQPPKKRKDSKIDMSPVVRETKTCRSFSVPWVLRIAMCSYSRIAKRSHRSASNET